MFLHSDKWASLPVSMYCETTSQFVRRPDSPVVLPVNAVMLASRKTSCSSSIEAMFWIFILIEPRLRSVKVEITPVPPKSSLPYRAAYVQRTISSLVNRFLLTMSYFWLGVITATFTGPRQTSMLPKAARPAAQCAKYCYHAIRRRGPYSSRCSRSLGCLAIDSSSESRRSIMVVTTAKTRHISQSL